MAGLNGVSFAYIYIIFNGSLECHRKLCMEEESGFMASKFVDCFRAPGALRNTGWNGTIMDSGNKPKQKKKKLKQQNTNSCCRFGRHIPAYHRASEDRATQGRSFRREGQSSRFPTHCLGLRVSVC